MLRQESPFCKIQQLVRVSSADTCVSPEMAMWALCVARCFCGKHAGGEVCFAGGVLLCSPFFYFLDRLPLFSFSSHVTEGDCYTLLCTGNLLSLNYQFLSVFWSCRKLLQSAKSPSFFFLCILRKHNLSSIFYSGLFFIYQIISALPVRP